MTIGTGRAADSGAWLTVDEVAAEAGIPAAEVRAAALRRDVAAVSTHPRGGGDWMFRRADVARWLERR